MTDANFVPGAGIGRAAILFSALVSMAAIVIVTKDIVSAKRLQAQSHRQAELNCLARNVYYEARGEPLVGQYAVAEVTLNRVVSPAFPATVCAVVHERHAFSWTLLDSPPDPGGLAWQRAMAVASSVYDNNEAPFVDGALFYHATYVVPGWASTRMQVVRINRHIFYL